MICFEENFKSKHISPTNKKRVHVKELLPNQENDSYSRVTIFQCAIDRSYLIDIDIDTTSIMTVHDVS